MKVRLTINKIPLTIHSFRKRAFNMLYKSKIHSHLNRMMYEHEGENKKRYFFSKFRKSSWKIRIDTVWVIIPRMLLSAIIIVGLQLVNIVDNCHDNKWIFHYHSWAQAFKSGVGREREGSKYDDCTRTIIVTIMPLYWLVAAPLL